MKAKQIQTLQHCPHCDRVLRNVVIIQPKKYGYNAEYIKKCKKCGVVKSEFEGGFIEICGNCKIAQVFDMYCERCGHRVGRGGGEPTTEEQSNLPWGRGV